MTNLIFPISVGVVAFILIVIFLCRLYRVADADKALIITGGKEPKIKISGGALVIPIIRKASFFSLSMLTVKTSRDVIGTKTAVPIIIDWTAQIRPVTDDMKILNKAIRSFKERGQNGIIEDVKQTIMGAVRAVVANLTPEEVRKDQEAFKQSIRDSIFDELRDMGLELVSLNIQDITDENGYYEDIAAIDREEKRREAEKVKAIADQEIRQQNAESEKIAKQNELDTELQIAEKTKDNNLKKAAFKIETDKANADAEIAGELQRTVRLQEVATQEGKVEVVRQEQANLAAQKRKEVVKTNAEAEKIQAEIKAEEEANVATINAKAQAKVMEEEAIGKANAIKAEAEAEANRIRVTGETEADIIAKKGAAEAEKERAILLAKAEGEKALAEARAGNDKVNFEIEKIKIENDAKIQIATNMATVMAEIGKNAEFVNIGGASGSNGNVLLDTLKGVPALLKTLDVENQALNNQTFNASVSDLIGAVSENLKGLGLLSTSESLDKSTHIHNEGSTYNGLSED